MLLYARICIKRVFLQCICKKKKNQPNTRENLQNKKTFDRNVVLLLQREPVITLRSKTRPFKKESKLEGGKKDTERNEIVPITPMSADIAHGERSEKEKSGFGRTIRRFSRVQPICRVDLQGIQRKSNNACSTPLRGADQVIKKTTHTHRHLAISDIFPKIDIQMKHR
jgi:hypothetical protein